MSDHPNTPSTTTVPKAPKPRKEKGSLDIIKDIDELALQITDMNELTFVRNRLEQRIEKLANAGNTAVKSAEQE
jgi:hypothetical protein